MKQSYINFIEKTVRAKCPELAIRVPTNYETIHLEHILRTMGGKVGMIGDGQFCKYNEHSEQFEMYQDDEFGDHLYDYPVFNLSLSWKDQEEPVLKFLAETLGFNQ